MPDVIFPFFNLDSVFLMLVNSAAPDTNLLIVSKERLIEAQTYGRELAEQNRQQWFQGFKGSMQLTYYT